MSEIEFCLACGCVPSLPGERYCTHCIEEAIELQLEGTA